MDYNKISKEVREQGVSSVPGFLSTTKFKKVYEILGKNLSPKGGKTSHLPVSSISYLIKILKFDFLAIKKSSVLKKVAKELDLNKLANNILGKKTKLLDIDSYLSIKSGKNVLEWHCDKAYNGDLNPKTVINPNLRSIKFFIYLTDVKYKNGSLAYIPYSHIVQKAYSDLLYDKKIKYKPFWALKDFRYQILLEPIKTMLINNIGKNIYDSFLENSSFINNSGDTNIFDNEMKKSGVVIFDELGFHRGSMPSQNDRLILRYFYNYK